MTVKRIDQLPAASTVDGGDLVMVMQGGVTKKATASLVGASGGGTVTSVGGAAPISSTGGATPVISIAPATTSTAGSMSGADKTKLDGVAAGANNYTHPASHPPSIITQDANNRFVTDAEKTSWDGKAPIASPTFTGTVSGITKAMVGLGNVDNTADTAKPVSTAQQTALNLKANLASPTFTGTVGGITAAMVGLGNVNNTSDANKPVSTAQQTALDAKAPIASPTFTGTVSGITAAMVGLGNVDNTADASKPVSTATQTALDAKANLANPTFTGTVGGITAAMVGLGNVDNTADTAKPVSTAQQTALNLKANLASPTFTGTVSGITKAMVGLGNVDNTADTAKPVSTATQTALNAKAPLASPTFTGTVTFPSGGGDFSVAAGTGDGASTTVYNTAIKAWWGIGFRDYLNLTTVKAYIDCRAGIFAGQQLTSLVATGTAPLVVASTTKVTNLNADLLDGMSAADFSPVVLTSGQVITALGYTPGSAAGLSASVISTNTTATAGSAYVFTASLTLTLPASPLLGNVVQFSNMSGTTTCVIARNGKNILGVAEDMTIDKLYAGGALMYTDATRGWVLV